MIRYYFRIALILVSTFLASAGTLAQSPQQITGIIKDQTGQTIKAARVVLSARDGRQLSVVTKEDGSFTFTNLKSDDYFIKVIATGFPNQLAPEIHLTNESQTVNITLDPNRISEDIVVTAENSVQPIDEVAKSLTAIDNTQITTRNEYAIGETLATEPGITNRSFGGPGALNSIRLRGLGNEDTAILIDGLRLRDAGEVRGSSLSLNDSLFVDNIERVEILRGSGSSLYGTNAVGGVINLVPFVGAGRPTGEVSFEGGGLGFLRESARVGGELGSQFSYSLGASRIDTNDGIDGHDIYRSSSLSTSLHYTPTSNLSISGIVNYGRSFLQVNESPFPIGPAGNELGYATGSGPITGFISDLNDPDSFRTIKYTQAGVALHHRISDIVSYYGSFNFVRSDRRFFNGPASDPFLVQLVTNAQGFFPSSTSDSRFNGTTYTFNGGLNLKLDRHNLLSISFEAEKERLRQTTDFFGKESFSQKSYGLYFQDQLHYFENRLQLSASGRVQFFNLSFPAMLANVPAGDLAQLKKIGVPRAYTGDGAIAYNFFSTGTKFRAHVGNSFRAPALSERFSAFDSSFAPVRIGNPFLRPERALSVDGGVEQTLFKRVRLSLTYFYTKRQEIISAGFIPFSVASGAAFFQTNTPGGLARGMEVALTANLAPGLELKTAYTYVNSEFRFNALRSDGTIINGSTRALGIPRNNFSLIVTEQYKRLNLGFDLTATSDYDALFFSPAPLFTGFASPVFRLDGHVKADLSGSYTLLKSEKGSLVLFGKIANLFDRTYFEDGFKTPSITGTGGLKFRF